MKKEENNKDKKERLVELLEQKELKVSRLLKEIEFLKLSIQREEIKRDQVLLYISLMKDNLEYQLYFKVNELIELLSQSPIDLQSRSKLILNLNNLSSILLGQGVCGVETTTNLRIKIQRLNTFDSLKKEVTVYGTHSSYSGSGGETL